MTNKLVVIITSLKLPKIKKILLYEMKFLVPIYSCLQNPWLGGYRPQIPVLSVLCPQLNLLNPPPPKKIPGYATEALHILSVFVALVISMQSACAMLYWHLWHLRLYMFPRYVIHGTILGEKSYWTKNVFLFSLILLSKPFLILRRIEWDVMNVFLVFM